MRRPARSIITVNANPGDLVNSQTAHSRRRRSLVGLFLALAVFAGIGIAAPQALAYATYVHGSIDTYGCEECHLNGHTLDPPVNEVCNTCHPGYALPSVSTMCWTCHAPGQDMSGARTDASCTAVCHLVDGTTSTHVAHTDRSSMCSTCHPLTASVTDAAGSPHHTLPRPPAPVLAAFLPTSGVVGDLVTLTGSGLIGAYAVSLNGTSATVFHLISGTQITAIVPGGATSGPIAVTTPGGTGTSATSLNVITAVTARVTLRAGTTSLLLGKTVRLTGALTPASLAGNRVHLIVKVRTNGEWTTARSAFLSTKKAGAYAWIYRPPRRGRYRVQATIAKTSAHSAAQSQRAAFTVR